MSSYQNQFYFHINNKFIGVSVVRGVSDYFKFDIKGRNLEFWGQLNI